MSATEEHDWMPGGLDRAVGRAGCDPSPFGVPGPAWERTDGVEEAAAPSGLPEGVRRPSQGARWATGHNGRVGYRAVRGGGGV